MSNPAVLLRNVKPENITLYFQDGKHKIAHDGRPLYANLSECPITKPLRARFKLDDPREEAGSRGGADERRGQALEIDLELLEAIQKLEEKCVQ